MSEHKIQTSLPDNAYRELRPGESYVPMVPGSVKVPEVTLRSILFGLLMCVLFSMAASYLALKVGQGIETAIPISVLALGLSGVLVRAGMRKSSLIENVNVLAISTTSGIVAGGSVFTMPAVSPASASSVGDEGMNRVATAVDAPEPLWRLPERLMIVKL